MTTWHFSLCHLCLMRLYFPITHSKPLLSHSEYLLYPWVQRTQRWTGQIICLGELTPKGGLIMNKLINIRKHPFPLPHDNMGRRSLVAHDREQAPKDSLRQGTQATVSGVTFPVAQHRKHFCLHRRSMAGKEGGFWGRGTRGTGRLALYNNTKGRLHRTPASWVQNMTFESIFLSLHFMWKARKNLMSPQQPQIPKKEQKDHTAA